jgi:hypothetical protein
MKQSKITNPKSKMLWRKVKESNPRDAMLGLVFKTSCAPPRTTFLNEDELWSLYFELRCVRTMIQPAQDVKVQKPKYKAHAFCVRKIDEGRENIAANTLRGTLLLKMAISWDSRKGPRSSSVEGSLPSSLANRYFDCQKTKGAGFKPPREAARSFNSREFRFEIWERESAPANYCLIWRLSMDISCPSLPPKLFVADEVGPNEQTTGYMAAHRCHFIVCSLYVLLFSIEVSLSHCAIGRSRESSCIKYQ